MHWGVPFYVCEGHLVSRSFEMAWKSNLCSIEWTTARRVARGANENV